MEKIFVHMDATTINTQSGFSEIYKMKSTAVIPALLFMALLKSALV